VEAVCAGGRLCVRRYGYPHGPAGRLCVSGERTGAGQSSRERAVERGAQSSKDKQYGMIGGMGQLDGKGAIVTGGSRGIGRAIVARLAADGATVVFSYVKDEAAAREVADETGAFAVRADQGSLADLNHLFEQADAHLKATGLHVVVCNAGDSISMGFAEVTEEAYDRHMAVNAKGPFFLIQHAGRALSDGGRIIAISTVNTRIHPPKAALHTGGKGAVEHFIKVAALSYGGRGITANIISPGATDTDGLRASNPPGATFADTIGWTALGRLGRPEDIASAVAMLAGPDGAWITGQNIAVDGGILP
jgi:3-oxoacyl-[acyl-carrier protein] reductase